MANFKFPWLVLSLLALSLIGAGAQAATSIKVAFTFPKNSAGEKIATSLPTSTKISPCNDTTKIDAATFTVTYDATNPKSTKTTPLAPLDVYLFFYNPDTVDGTNKFYSVYQGKVVSIAPYADADAVKHSTVTPYLAGVDNYNTGSVTETLFGTAIRLDGLTSQSSSGLNTGTWQLIGILADSSFDFANPSTWVAWDVVTVMFGMPWSGNTLSTVTTKTCQ